MRGAWTILLIGCGFHSSNNATNDAPPPDGSDDAAPDGTVVLHQICSSIASLNPQFQAAACATPTTNLIDVSATTSIDTNLGTSNPAGLTCVVVSNQDSNPDSKVCALVAPTIVIESGAVLSAHGPFPLALFAHAITIRGTIDVASHIDGAVGAGSLPGGCLTGMLPRGAGGGRGGNLAQPGGQGGDDGTTPATGGHGGGTFVTDAVTGSCGGTHGGDGTAGGGPDGGTTTGGAGGGGLWLVSDTTQLVIDNGAVINASGASGAGGAAGHGGSGGGAGGLIVLQAQNIKLHPGAMVFANGGHGGGGAGANPTGTGFTPGAPGTDPTDPLSGGGGGAGGTSGTSLLAAAPGPGDGGFGYSATGPMRDGQTGATTSGGGGGGGGGGGAPGAIFVTSSHDVAGSNVSPAPVRLQ